MSSDSSSLSLTTTFKDGVPINYSLPKCFSASVMQSLDNKKMMLNTRSAFVRELVVHMTSFGIRPTRNFCATAARRIILKYLFLRDAVRNGYVRHKNILLLILKTCMQAIIIICVIMWWLIHID